MSKDRNEDIKANFQKSPKAAREETCNEYYTRKMRTTESELAPDGEAELVDNDDSFSEARNYDSDAGPLNYKKWDRYGK